MVRLTKVSTFRDSSVVEQVAVNDLVVGSNPTRGASKILNTPKGVFLILRLRERKTPARLSLGFESRSDVSLRTSEAGSRKFLKEIIRDRILLAEPTRA